MHRMYLTIATMVLAQACRCPAALPPQIEAEHREKHEARMEELRAAAETVIVGKVVGARETKTPGGRALDNGATGQAILAVEVCNVDRDTQGLQPGDRITVSHGIMHSEVMPVPGPAPYLPKILNVADVRRMYLRPVDSNLFTLAAGDTSFEIASPVQPGFPEDPAKSSGYDRTTIVGRSGNMIVMRTPDGGYRCAAEHELTLPPEKKEHLAHVGDATPIYRAHQICARLRELPGDFAILNALGKTACDIQDDAAFVHYASIYYLGCLSLDKPKRARNVMQAIRKRKHAGPYGDLLAWETLTEPCAACQGSGRTPGVSRERCSTCDGTGRVIMTWKAERTYHELVRDGDLSMSIVKAELGRVAEPPPDDPPAGDDTAENDLGEEPEADISDGKNGEAPAVEPEPPAPLTVTPKQVKADVRLRGKTVVVPGEITGVVRQMGGYWFVVLDGHLRCQLRKGLKASARMRGHYVHILGTVVPRPDLHITAKPHMVNCQIL